MHVHADELALLLHVGNHVVDGNFSGSTGSGGHCNGEHRLVLGGGNPFQRTNVSKLRVVDDNADGLGRIHGGTAANGNDVISTAGLVGSYAGLHIFNGGVGLDVGINLIVQASLVQHIRNLLGYTELEQIRVRAEESLLQPTTFNLSNDGFDGATAMIGNRIQNDTIRHWKRLLIMFHSSGKPLTIMIRHFFDNLLLCGKIYLQMSSSTICSKASTSACSSRSTLPPGVQTVCPMFSPCRTTLTVTCLPENSSGRSR